MVMDDYEIIMGTLSKEVRECLKGTCKPMTRVFETGATRDTDEEKLDYEGFISPQVWTEFAKYMHECRLRNIPPGEKIRSSDNWQKGIPKTAYMKSMFRHFMDVWTTFRESLRNPNVGFGRRTMIRALCALMFNVQGMMHELLKEEEEWKKNQASIPAANQEKYPIYP
jgi:hypothetical protein